MVTVASLFRDAVQVTPTRDGGSLRSSRLRTIYWIHFPKTSSLFATTVLTYACVLAYRVRLYPVIEYGPLIHE